MIKNWIQKFKSLPNNSKKILNVNYEDLIVNEKFLKDKYLHATVYKDDRKLTEKIEYLTNFKNLTLTKPLFSYEVKINHD